MSKLIDIGKSRIGLQSFGDTTIITHPDRTITYPYPASSGTIYYSMQLDGTQNSMISYNMSPPDTLVYSLTASFSVELWVKFDGNEQNSSDQCLFSTFDHDTALGSGQFSLHYDRVVDRLTVWYDKIPDIIVSSDSITGSMSATQNDVWYHFAITHLKWNGSFNSELKFYRDGTQIGATKEISGINQLDPLDDNLSIGGQPDALTGSNRNTFSGYMSDVRLWEQDIPQSQIQTNMNTRLNGNEQFLWGYWKLDNDIYDYTGRADSSGTMSPTGSVSFVVDTPF